MKRIYFIFVICLIAACSYSQEHIKFNGATFGLPLNEFIKGFPKSSKSTISLSPKGYNPDLCNWHAYLIRLNSQDWECHIFSSRTSDTVFRTICAESFSDLKNNLMLYVKTLEEKYGSGIPEKQENLGEIRYLGDDHREMMALYYYIKSKNGKRIGEIRISAAPRDREAKSGWIELSYTDYSSRDKATREYNSKMRNAL